MTDTDFRIEDVAADIGQRIRQDTLDMTHGWADNNFPPIPTIGVACHTLLTFLLVKLDEDQMREFMDMLLQLVERNREIALKLEEEGVTNENFH